MFDCLTVRRRALRGAHVLGSIPLLLAASLPPVIHFELDPARSTVWFEADATLGAFTGTAERVRGWAEVEDTAALAQVSGEVVIDVASFRTGIGVRDGHLRGDMHADRHPEITFVLTGTAPGDAATADAAGAARADSLPRADIVLSGLLTIQAETRDVQIPARIRFAADTLYVHGRLPIRFTDFGMKPPSRMLGLTKVDDRLTLAFDAAFGVRP